MKVCSIAAVLLVTAIAGAEDSARRLTTYTYDGSGRRLEGPSASVVSGPEGTYRTDRVESINGRRVPLESVEQRVLQDDSTGKVTERIVRRYDANGRPGPPEKVRIEERKNADGTSTSVATVYQADLNGRFDLRERSTTHSQKNNGSETATTQVERPTVNGALELVEKQVRVSQGPEDSYREDVTIYRRDNQRFQEAARVTTERTKQEGQQVETVAEYNAASTGDLRLATQTVTRTSTAPDGSETRLVDIYGAVAAGRTIEGFTSGPQLREQQRIEKTPGPGGTVVESFSIRRPAVAGGNQLGAFQKISEVVCTGQCLPAKK